MGSRGQRGRRGGGHPGFPAPTALRRLLEASREAARGILTPWFGLTAAEQDAALAVMALFAFGLAVRWWLTRP